MVPMHGDRCRRAAAGDQDDDGAIDDERHVRSSSASGITPGLDRLREARTATASTIASEHADDEAERGILRGSAPGERRPARRGSRRPRPASVKRKFQTSSGPLGDVRRDAGEADDRLPQQRARSTSVSGVAAATGRRRGAAPRGRLARGRGRRVAAAPERRVIRHLPGDPRRDEARRGARRAPYADQRDDRAEQEHRPHAAPSRGRPAGGSA